MRRRAKRGQRGGLGRYIAVGRGNALLVRQGQPRFACAVAPDFWASPAPLLRWSGLTSRVLPGHVPTVQYPTLGLDVVLNASRFAVYPKHLETWVLLPYTWRSRCNADDLSVDRTCAAMTLPWMYYQLLFISSYSSSLHSTQAQRLVLPPRVQGTVLYSALHTVPGQRSMTQSPWVLVQPSCSPCTRAVSSVAATLHLR